MVGSNVSISLSKIVLESIRESRLGLNSENGDTFFFSVLAVASDTILRRYRVIDWPA